MRRYLAALLCLLLVACASVPLSNQIAGGFTVIAGYQDRIALLYKAGVMTREDATQRLDQIETAGKNLSLAKSALAVCDLKKLTTCADAENRTAAVSAILDQLDAYLIAKAAQGRKQ